MVTKASKDTLELEVEMFKRDQENNRQLLEKAKTNAEAFAALKKDAERMSTCYDQFKTMKQEKEALNDRFDQYMKVCVSDSYCRILFCIFIPIMSRSR